MKKMKCKISVLSSADLDPVEEARLQLLSMAQELHQRAADAHAEGMYYEGQSARVEQLADIATGEQLLNMRDLFVKEGVVEVLPGVNAIGSEA
jgi:hypothetical protein